MRIPADADHNHKICDIIECNHSFLSMMVGIMKVTICAVVDHINKA